MKLRILVAYQTLTGLSDALTGVLLIFFPELTLHLMRLREPADTLPFLSYIGAFVLSVGLACLYGALLARKVAVDRLEVVWLLTAITRGLVAIFVTASIVSGDLAPGWATVAVSDALLSALQGVGLARGWLQRVKV
jgi:hypothetical protein